MSRRSSSSTPSTSTSSDDLSGERTAAVTTLPVTEASDPLEGVLTPFQESVEVVREERALRTHGQAVAPENVIESRPELGADLREVGGRRPVADPDVRRPVDEAVIQDGVQVVPVADTPQVPAREDMVVVDPARLDELRGERRPGVEVARVAAGG